MKPQMCKRPGGDRSGDEPGASLRLCPCPHDAIPLSWPSLGSPAGNPGSSTNQPACHSKPEGAAAPPPLAASHPRPQARPAHPRNRYDYAPLHCTATDNQPTPMASPEADCTLPEWTPPSTLPAPPASPHPRPPKSPQALPQPMFPRVHLAPEHTCPGWSHRATGKRGVRESRADGLRHPCDCPLPPETPREESDGTDTAEPTRRAAILGRGEE